MRQKVFLWLAIAMGVVLAFATPHYVLAVNNSTFNQTINAGVLSTDILDNTGASVASPSVSMSAKNFAFTLTLTMVAAVAVPTVLTQTLKVDN